MRKIFELMEMYDRMEQYNREQKEKTVEAMNYSILTGMILTSQNEAQL